MPNDAVLHGASRNAVAPRRVLTRRRRRDRPSRPRGVCVVSGSLGRGGERFPHRGRSGDRCARSSGRYAFRRRHPHDHERRRRRHSSRCCAHADGATCWMGWALDREAKRHHLRCSQTPSHRSKRRFQIGLRGDVSYSLVRRHHIASSRSAPRAPSPGQIESGARHASTRLAPPPSTRALTASSSTRPPGATPPAAATRPGSSWRSIVAPNGSHDS